MQKLISWLFISDVVLRASMKTSKVAMSSFYFVWNHSPCRLLKIMQPFCMCVQEVWLGLHKTFRRDDWSLFTCELWVSFFPLKLPSLLEAERRTIDSLYTDCSLSASSKMMMDWLMEYNEFGNENIHVQERSIKLILIFQAYSLMTETHSYYIFRNKWDRSYSSTR